MKKKKETHPADPARVSGGAGAFPENPPGGGFRGGPPALPADPLTAVSPLPAAEPTAPAPGTPPDAPEVPAASPPGNIPADPADLAPATEPAPDPATVRAALALFCALRERGEEEEALRSLEDTCPGIGERGDEVRRAAAALPFLSALPVRRRLAVAFLLLRGMEAETPRSTEERLSALLSDRELLCAFAQENARRRAERERGLPPAPLRTARAPADVRRPPATLSAAAQAAKATLRMKR